MKALILAGGLGTRLGKYTKDIPKCMLEFEGKTLLEWQIDTLKKSGIEDIVVIRKHFADKINIPHVRYIDETDYSTHMVVGLFQARSEFNDDILLTYGDILFELKVVLEAAESDADIGIVADIDWKEYWTERYGNWKEDSESFVIGKDGKVESLGIPLPSVEKMHARYVGMIKFSKNILEKIESIYDKANKAFWEKPWYSSKSFKKAYMTDFLQALIDNGLDVRAIKIQRGWLEFDTEKDYELANEWLKSGKIERFLKLKKREH